MNRSRANRSKNQGRSLALASSATGKAAAAVIEVLEQRTLLSAVDLLDIGQFRGRPGQLGAVNNVTLFTTTDFPAGQVLWATDGSPRGTRVVKDLEPAASRSDAWFIGGRDNALTVGNTFYFTGVDNAYGRELWRSDGTPEGTRMVADLVAGRADSNPEGFVELNGMLIFTADRKIWRSDGTESGTVMIKDADPLGLGQPERMAAMNGHVYFTIYPQQEPYNSVHNTGQLWRTDGTTEGTVMIRDVSSQTWDPTDTAPSRTGLINVGGTLYFSANDGKHGYELWRSNGTKRGTVLVRDLVQGSYNPNMDGSYPTHLTDVNGTLFFSANGFLYRSDGTAAGTIKLKTVTQPRGFVNVSGILFFVNGDNLWVSDGSRAGTRMVVEGEIAERFGPATTASLNGRLYFGANGGGGFELHQSDGTLGQTWLAFEAEPGAASSHAEVLGRVGSKLIFTARIDSTSRWQVYALEISRPHAPRDLRMVSESDSGVSNSDRTTRVRRPIITGAAPSDSLVRLFAGDIEIGSAVARSGRFQIQPGVELPHGTHSLIAIARDDLNRTGESSEPLNVKIDLVPPTVLRLTAHSPQRLEIKFSENVGSTLSRSDVVIRNLVTGQTYTGRAIDVSYADESNIATITFPELGTGLPAGNYRLTLNAQGVSDVVGNVLADAHSFDFVPPLGPVVGLARNVLLINGTDAPDQIIVRRMASMPNRIEVEVNHSITTHAGEGITAIRIDARGGDDLVLFDHRNGVVQIRTSIYGGSGNDTITGGAHRDRIYGGDGDDLIRGGGGHDIIYGEAGNDTIFGERGNDYIVAGGGVNVIQGNAGADRLIVKMGVDDVLSDDEDTVLNQLT
jgi:ELWxxDGT repeat protein